ncbi:TlpA family protein disulfide reductase [Bremerella alba]|uniref:Thiol-disulfide oxidoreductase ResA n=1 Tax=Bremerella alba TaxID=980252 RepID=A0A7V8V1D5_9BACT|nr:TlpA disulfide reductase family protein [Bremerella alba]MBA2113145.1 Thiol-disulfide oxidoreductase ResA [Bremerella alba]
MKFAWTFTLAALLAAGQIAANTPLLAKDTGDDAAASTEVKEAAPKTFQDQFNAAMAVARTGGSDNLPTPERFEKAIEMIDAAWDLDRTPRETKQAISMKFSLLMAIDREEDSTEGNAIAFLKDLVQGEDAEIALHAENMLLSIELSQLRQLSASEQSELLNELKAPIIETEPTTRTATLAATLANTISRYVDSELAAEQIKDLATHFSSTEDPSVQEAATRLIGLSNRLNLPGNPIEITGTTLDGKDLNFATKFEGKTVLIDFWATWCGPCIAEFPNMKRLYETYHPHGLEIVGISLDDEKSTVDEFMQTHELPWTIVFNQRGEGERGWTDENAGRYGISGIPTMILVGKDGNVTSLTARGHNLGQLLAEAYPDVDASGEDEPADAKQAEAETE